MAILKMMRLTAIVPEPMRRELLRDLYRLGCVEIEGAGPTLKEQYGDILHMKEESTGAAQTRQILERAIAALGRFAPEKGSLFSARRQVSENLLFDEKSLDGAMDAARQIVALSTAIDEAASAQNRLSARISSLRPWKDLDSPLEYSSSVTTVFHMGVLPASTDTQALFESLEAEAPNSHSSLISSDREQHYITVLIHRTDEEKAMGILKARGFSPAGFKDLTGTAAQNIAAFRAQIESLDDEIAKNSKKIAEFAPARADISMAADAYTLKSRRDSLLSLAARTDNTVVLTGWVPETSKQCVSQALDSRGCAWEIKDPDPGDSPPTAVLNNQFVDPFTGITDMYGTPTYESVIDPNPFVSIFYFIFFGFMMGDAMYGIIIMAATWAFLHLARPSGNTRRMIKMFFYCGLATFIAGALTGGWFADAVLAVSSRITGGDGFSIPPLWFDPLGDPIRMLKFSLVIGAVQMSVGMLLAAYRMIKLGRPLDALFDVGSWFVLFAGLGMMAAGLSAGSYAAGAGVLSLLLTGGRNNKGIGKLTGGLGQLYGITGYISDILSYSRIMALGMSGAVVGQVVNKIAVMGNGILGVVLFVFVFCIGHAFNLSINILGAYVHTSRLQYIEFFGRFFEDGGRPFKPLFNNTKYVEIVRED
jgi:V/A-type H+-transporting ATPase subunit I